MVTSAMPISPITFFITSTGQGEPVLAHWQVGLGQVAAFTSDAREDNWARLWSSWPGYAEFWTGLARNLSRPSSAGPYELRLVRDGDGLVLRLDAADERHAVAGDRERAAPGIGDRHVGEIGIDLGEIGPHEAGDVVAQPARVAFAAAENQLILLYLIKESPFCTTT